MTNARPLIGPDRSILASDWSTLTPEWPVSCHWYQGPVSLHNGGCIVTTEAWHLVIIGEQINTYSAHWWLLGSLNIRGDGDGIQISFYILTQSLFSRHWPSSFPVGFCFKVWIGWGKKVDVTCEGSLDLRLVKEMVGRWFQDYHGQGKWPPPPVSSG